MKASHVFRAWQECWCDEGGEERERLLSPLMRVKKSRERDRSRLGLA